MSPSARTPLGEAGQRTGRQDGAGQIQPPQPAGLVAPGPDTGILPPHAAHQAFAVPAPAVLVKGGLEGGTKLPSRRGVSQGKLQ